MKNIVTANIGKRVFAAVLDMLLAVFLYILAAQFIFTPIANASIGYDQANANYARYQIYSHLYIFIEYDENSQLYTPVKMSEYDAAKTSSYTNINLQSLPDYNLSTTIDYTYYEGQIRYYYLNYLTGENLEKPSESIPDSDVRAPNYDQTVVIDGTDTGILPKDYYTLDWYYQNILLVNNDSSPFAVTDGTLTLKEGKSNDDAMYFLLDASHQNVYYNATYHLYYSDYFQSNLSTIINGQVISFVPPFFLVLLVLYLAVPLIFKNGETLCKKMLNIGLLNIKEYQVTRPQVLLRQLVFIAEMTLSYFIIPIIFQSYNESNLFSYLATMGLGCFLLLIVTFFNQNRRTLHDFIALTFTIDTRKSVWFDDANQEDRSETQLAENLAKYEKNENAIGENVIQVGSTIIEERAHSVLGEDEVSTDEEAAESENEAGGGGEVANEDNEVNKKDENV